MPCPATYIVGISLDSLMNFLILFLLGSSVYYLTHLISVTGQLISVIIISSSTIVLLKILFLDCDLAHLIFVTGQLCNPQQSSVEC